MASDTMTSGPGLVSGGWSGSEMAVNTGSWQLALPGDVREDLLRAAAGLPPDAVAVNPFGRRPEVSACTRALVADLCRRLAGEPGFVLLTGFPVRESPELVQAAYWLLGMLVGQPLRQGGDGELMSRVEDLADDTRRPGSQLPIALPFHVDRCADLVALLCVRPAASGGLSMLISGKKVHNVLLAENPDLLAVLYQAFPYSAPPFRGADRATAAARCDIPVFSRAGDYFASYYIRFLIEEAQSLDDIPRLTRRQLAALDAIDEIMSRPGLSLRMALRPGDVQLINNLKLLHARTAYAGDGDRGRLLLRLWLAFAGSAALPAAFATLLGSAKAGTYRGGTWRTPEVRERLGTTLTMITTA